MFPQKFFLKSKTVIGILVMALVQLAPELGFSFTEDDGALVNTTVDTVITAIASVLALWGRLTAQSELTARPNGSANTLRAGVIPTLLAVGVILLAGCSQVPSQNHGIVAASQTIAELARQTDRLQRNGLISNEREDEILDTLADANSQLRLAESVLDGCPEPCSEASGILLTVDNLLTQIEADLRDVQ